MFKSRAFNRVMLSAPAVVAGFIMLWNIFTPANLIILLNGLFAGAMVAIIIAYSKLVWYAALGIGRYDRVRQMTLGFALCWAAISVNVATSIWLQMGEFSPAAITSIAFARYLAIVAAIMQVTAPDFGLGLFHGRDRKVLFTATILGLAVAFLVIILQGA